MFNGSQGRKMIFVIVAGRDCFIDSASSTKMNERNSMVAKIQRLGALCLVVFIADSNFGRAAVMAPCISCIELVFLCSVRHGDGAPKSGK